MQARDRFDPGWGYGGPRYPGAFLLALQDALTSMNWRCQRWLPSALECLDAQGREQFLGLDNLYRRVRPLERLGWPGMLAEFLAQVPAEIADSAPPQLNAVADRMLVRLGAPFPRQDQPTDVWSQVLVPGHLSLALVVDSANSMMYVTEQMIAASGLPASHWMERAIGNLRALAPETRLEVAHPESGLLHSDAGDAYDASRALLLDTLLPGHEEHGFFVAVPGRDHLLVMPVTLRTIAFLPWLRTVCEKTHGALPYPISAEVFWTRQGQWHQIAIDLKAEPVTVTPPQEFLPIIERLSPPSENQADERD